MRENPLSSFYKLKTLVWDLLSLPNNYCKFFVNAPILPLMRLFKDITISAWTIFANWWSLSYLFRINSEKFLHRSLAITLSIRIIHSEIFFFSLYKNFCKDWLEYKITRKQSNSAPKQTTCVSCNFFTTRVNSFSASNDSFWAIGVLITT